jgi:putative FmdB family regulatory protein
MPTYSYQCTECDNAFDIQQAFTDSSLTVCPACGGKLRKVFGVVGITFNGSGFYRTDSRSGSDKHGSKHHAKAESAKTDAAKSDAVKSDAKAGAVKGGAKPAVASSGTPSTAGASKAASTAK